MWKWLTVVWVWVLVGFATLSIPSPAKDFNGGNCGWIESWEVGVSDEYADHYGWNRWDSGCEFVKDISYRFGYRLSANGWEN